MAQLFLNNFDSVLIAAVKSVPETAAPDSELGYGILRLSDGAAGRLLAPAAGDWYTLTLFTRSGTGEGDYEIVKVTAVDNSVVGECRITVKRGQEGTVQKAYASGDPVEMRLTAGTLQNLLQQADPSLVAPREPAGPAGGVLAGSYPNPSFKEAMATVAQLGAKVDKVAGKGLSANDLTNELLAKLAGMAEQATKNDTDANLRARSTHTGVQAIATITGLADALQALKQRSTHEGLQPIDTVEGLAAALGLLAPLASPAFSGAPTVPTAKAGDASTKVANTAFVSAATEAMAVRLLGNAPLEALDTLEEFGRAIGNDADFAATTTRALSGKVDKVAGKGLSANDLTNELLKKLGAIAEGATKNAADEALLDRSKHTGTQAIGTVAGLSDALSAANTAIGQRIVKKTVRTLNASEALAVNSINAIDASSGTAIAVTLPTGEPGDSITLVNHKNSWGAATVAVHMNQSNTAVVVQGGGTINISNVNPLVFDTNVVRRVEFVCLSSGANGVWSVGLVL